MIILHFKKKNIQLTIKGNTIFLQDLLVIIRLIMDKSIFLNF